jgi:predicted RNase H-like nuclease (RuvC/YqgF family)
MGKWKHTPVRNAEGKVVATLSQGHSTCSDFDCPEHEVERLRTEIHERDRAIEDLRGANASLRAEVGRLAPEVERLRSVLTAVRAFAAYGSDGLGAEAVLQSIVTVIDEEDGHG